LGETTAARMGAVRAERWESTKAYEREQQSAVWTAESLGGLRDAQTAEWSVSG
jgi:hypothetical protein